MSIIQNATLSIQAGLEDLQAATPSRTLSCVRNLHAGVLLLLKAKLQELSPAGSDDVLLKQRIVPRRGSSGSVDFAGHGKKTVDTHELRSRLSSLGVNVDWQRVEKLSRERNNIEHYYATVADASLRGLAADVLVVIRDFAGRELNQDPMTLLGPSAWEQLLQNAEVYAQEKAACEAALGAISWKSRTLSDAVLRHSCSACGSPLLMPTGTADTIDSVVLSCRSCGHGMNASEYVPSSLQEHLAHDTYSAMKDGCAPPIAACPNCFTESFVLEEDACALCEYERAHVRCIQCCEEIQLEEQELGGLCGCCHHVATKDD